MNQIKKQKIALIIPVYNEEGSIGKVIEDIPKHIVDQIIVVNFGINAMRGIAAHTGGDQPLPFSLINRGLPRGQYD